MKTNNPNPSLNRFGAVAEAITIAVILWIANQYWHHIGFWFWFEEPATYVPVLSAEFPTYLPHLNTAWQGVIFLAILKLIFGQWSPILRLVEAIVTTVTAWMLFQLVIGPNLFALRPDLVVSNANAQAIAEQWLPILSQIMRVGFALSLVTTTISTLKKFTTLFRDLTHQLTDDQTSSTATNLN